MRDWGARVARPKSKRDSPELLSAARAALCPSRDRSARRRDAAAPDRARGISMRMARADGMRVRRACARFEAVEQRTDDAVDERIRRRVAARSIAHGQRTVCIVGLAGIDVRRRSRRRSRPGSDLISRRARPGPSIGDQLRRAARDEVVDAAATGVPPTKKKASSFPLSSSCALSSAASVPRLDRTLRKAIGGEHRPRRDDRARSRPRRAKRACPSGRASLGDMRACVATTRWTSSGNSAAITRICVCGRSAAKCAFARTAWATTSDCASAGIDAIRIHVEDIGDGAVARARANRRGPRVRRHRASRSAPRREGW